MIATGTSPAENQSQNGIYLKSKGELGTRRNTRVVRPCVPRFEVDLTGYKATVLSLYPLSVFVNPRNIIPTSGSLVVMRRCLGYAHSIWKNDYRTQLVKGSTGNNYYNSTNYAFERPISMAIPLETSAPAKSTPLDQPLQIASSRVLNTVQETLVDVPV